MHQTGFSMMTRLHVDGWIMFLNHDVSGNNGLLNGRRNEALAGDIPFPQHGEALPRFHLEEAISGFPSSHVHV